jgi:hypothetical protein
MSIGIDGNFRMPWNRERASKEGTVSDLPPPSRGRDPSSRFRTTYRDLRHYPAAGSTTRRGENRAWKDDIELAGASFPDT